MKKFNGSETEARKTRNGKEKETKRGGSRRQGKGKVNKIQRRRSGSAENAEE